jgi:DNA-binding transcriptional ArsR family regulator
VTRYLQVYRPGGKAEFVEEDVFRTIVPVPVSSGVTNIAVPTPVDALAAIAALKMTEAVKQRLRRELKLLSTAQPLTATEVATQLGVEQRTVRRDLQVLRDAGLIEAGTQYGSYQLRQS